MEKFFTDDTIKKYVDNIKPTYRNVNIVTSAIIKKSQLLNILLEKKLCDLLYGYLTRTLSRMTPGFIIDYIVIGNNPGVVIDKDNICGILIVQKGECVENPDNWTVRLVCNLQEDQCKNYGTVLLGAYMCELITKFENGSSKQNKGILELAEAYENLSGYCSYSKFGFIEDYAFVCSAFMPYNLKMTTEINDLSVEDIYKTVRENIRYKNNKNIKKRNMCKVQNEEFKNILKERLPLLKDKINIKLINQVFNDDKIPYEDIVTETENEIIQEIYKEDIEKNKLINERRKTGGSVDILPLDIPTSEKLPFYDEYTEVSEPVPGGKKYKYLIDKYGSIDKVPDSIFGEKSKPILSGKKYQALIDTFGSIDKVPKDLFTGESELVDTTTDKMGNLYLSDENLKTLGEKFSKIDVKDRRKKLDELISEYGASNTFKIIKKIKEPEKDGGKRKSIKRRKSLRRKSVRRKSVKRNSVRRRKSIRRK